MKLDGRGVKGTGLLRSHRCIRDSFSMEFLLVLISIPDDIRITLLKRTRRSDSISMACTFASMSGSAGISIQAAEVLAQLHSISMVRIDEFESLSEGTSTLTSKNHACIRSTPKELKAFPESMPSGTSA